jgi:glyoxylase-like metal-dependent hydrolase (beta-lactamase superfamily II)
LEVLRKMDKPYMVDTFKHREPNVIACYVLRHEKPVVIDPGPQSGVHNVVEELRRLKVKPKLIALTHVHLDHAGGAATLAKLFSAKVVVHPRGARHVVDPTRLWESSRTVVRELADVFGKPEPLEEVKIMVTEDCQTLDLGEDELVVLHAPGHAPHMQVYYLKDAKVLFPADAVGIGFNGYLVPSTPPPFDYDKALSTLKRLRRLEVELVALTHFGLADGEIVEKAEDKIREWREIATSCSDVDELIERLLKKDEDVKALCKRYPRDSVVMAFFRTSAQGIFSCARGASGP